MIIDDVFTTGATTSACAKVLKNAKAKDVVVLCVAATNHFANEERIKSKNVIKIKDFVKKS